MERSRLKESERQNAVLEERLLAAEARAERTEHAFDAFRMEQRATPEAALHADLARLAQAKQAVEGQLEAARRAKAKYKEQVRRMARELAGLHRDRAAAAAYSTQAAEAARTAKVAESQMAQLKAERRELRQLTQQLANMTQPAPAPPQPVPWIFPAPGYPGGAWMTSAAPEAESAAPGGQESKHGAEELAEPASAAELVSDSEEEAEAEDAHKDHAGGARPGSAAVTGSSRALHQDLAAASGNAPARSAEPTRKGTDAPPGTSDDSGTAGPSTTPEGAGRADPGAEARRLLQERADLVRTGVYRCGDRVIMELDRRIEALTKAAGST
ncbi:hypothetical protein CYMTET_20057 [Cymbomonas tetramitiformis]|uniref:Uncharacterized protein n=1 Tax=Cymbomonas tetramitiformis TaxID=36881 RepID=A0AAE0L4J8_9CHLO|nr:hypothetical protein CYMTET_20057 [Cymbomonas tetramitiformis]